MRIAIADAYHVRRQIKLVDRSVQIFYPMFPATFSGRLMLKVLVADSSLTSRRTLVNVLSNASCEVVGEAANAGQCLALAGSLQPHIICIDLALPDRSDPQLLSELKEKHPKAILMLVSADFSEESLRAGLACGAHGFIVKPFSAVKVLAAIRAAVVKVARQVKAVTANEIVQ